MSDTTLQSSIGVNLRCDECREMSLMGWSRLSPCNACNRLILDGYRKKRESESEALAALDLSLFECRG